MLSAYHEHEPDPSVNEQRVSFGTSGHRGRSLDDTLNEAHVLAVSEAVCRYRSSQGIDGPLFLGRDAHLLSEPAFRTILEVLAAHEVERGVHPLAPCSRTSIPRVRLRHDELERRPLTRR